MDSFASDLIATTELSRLFRDLNFDMDSSEARLALGAIDASKWRFLKDHISEFIREQASASPDLGLSMEEIQRRDALRTRILKSLQSCSLIKTIRIRDFTDRVAVFVKDRASNDELELICNELDKCITDARAHLRGHTTVSLHNLTATKDQMCRHHLDIHGEVGTGTPENCVCCNDVAFRMEHSERWLHRRGQAEYEIDINNIAAYLEAVEDTLQELCDKYDQSHTKSWAAFRPTK